MSRKIITTEETAEDKGIDKTLRPQFLKDYIGQEKIKSTLKIYIDAAKSRGEALDHVLFYGPPGLGKTTLCGIIANEMGVNLKVTSGPAIEKPGEMAAILNNLQEGDVLFVDEIHRLNRQVEEVLYPAMEDFAIDIMLGFSCQIDPAGSAEVYAGGCNYESRTFNGSFKRSIRCRPETGILYAEGAVCDRKAVGGCAWRGDR